MPEDFVLRALLAGLGVAVVAGPLGCFVVWRRMAYLGDSVAHSALLGVALGLLLGIDLILGVAATCLAVAVSVVLLQQQRRLAPDTVLGIAAHAGLSIGLVALSLMEAIRLDLLGYLFGDVLAVGARDLLWIYGGGAATLVVLGAIWRPLLAATVHEELARAEGVPTRSARLVFMLLIAVVIALAIKVVGVLLITSLLILPAAAARFVSRTPVRMALVSGAIGAVAVAAGLAASLAWDTPSGPSMVLAAAALFALSALSSLRTDAPAR